ncbi:MAG: helix-hairpin-helix domain-containing protein [Bacteroidetes bacterium]|nr:helix-hairpin-helix domain-containing protein [Bacteroidota bacterium]
MRILLLLVCSFASIFAQESLRSNDETAIEKILDDQGEEEGIQERGEELEYLRSHPVNILHPAYGELLSIPFVSPLLAESIILYTDTVKLEEIEQLQNVSLMTLALFEKIVPFITLTDNSVENEPTWFYPENVEFRSRMEQRLRTTKGFTEHIYQGNQLGSYQRVRLKNEHIEVVAMKEKDPGELAQNGFSTGYAELKHVSFIDDLIVGSYSSGASQGLVYAKNISPAKGSDAVGQTRKRGNFITPSISTDEFRYFNGTAFRLNLKPYSFTGIYSLRRLPALTDSEGMINSFYTSGLYRNRNELQKRNSLTERVTGGIAEYRFDGNATVTLTGMNVSYGSDVNSALIPLEFNRSSTAGSIGWDVPLKGVRTFGEVASNDARRFSSVAGIMIPVVRAMSLSYLHRTYSKGYASPFARPFGARANIHDGEYGQYLGMELELGHTSVSAFVDQYTLPSHNVSFAATGRETFFQLVHPVTKRSEVTVQIKSSIRSQEEEYCKSNYRLGFTHRISSTVTIAQRVERVEFRNIIQNTVEQGFLAFVDGNVHDRLSGIVLRSRIIWFQSPSYNTRMYQYESDLPGNFSNPPLYGTGVRWYILARYELFDLFSLGMKYAETKKLYEDVLGSGEDEIQGNLDNRIAVQIDFRF